VVATLGHRGPDQQGVFESAHASIGAVRLKIIDLAGGDQPIDSADGAPGGTIVAFNGEIYNHAELRAELESAGHRFRSRCDTEVVLRAFLEWDTASFARLRGMFAIALWNESERRLVLARDRLGIKPLYYHRRGPDLYFGSELKCLFGHAEIPRKLDLEALGFYLALNYVPCPFTLVEGIEKLPPGCWLEWRGGDFRIEPYWRLELRPDPKWTLDAAKEALDSLLRQSVREHLVSDVPLGIWASGGLDSSTILHYAAESGGGPLNTFSISFRGRSFDESPYFREIARRYGAEHREFDLNPEAELVSAIEQFAYYSDEPSADAGALPVWFLSRLSRRHVTVALSGEGADELFGGYLTYFADRVASRMRLLPAAARRLALDAVNRFWPVSDDKISFEYKLKRLLEGSLLAPDSAHFFWNGACSEAQRKRLCPAAGAESLETLVGRFPGAANTRVGFVNRYLLLDQHTYLPDDILCKVDRMSMAHSLEVRPPFLDHRIAEFAASLPESLKIRGAAGKYVLRELMRVKLPASVIERKKTGLDIPAHDWFRGALKPLLLDTLSADRLEESGIFNPDAVLDLMRGHFERRANVGYQLWGLLTLFQWMRRWGIEAPRETKRAEALAFAST
jgi:asparagine synthase (glutamine-hydrolysing)